MADNQEQMKPKEREIPVFTVLKNNCILKNIFVLDNPPPISSVLGAESVGQESEVEEILMVGRHPDCNIKLEHPSISRFHLRIHCKPSSRSVFVTDLSSVHGTCISGKRIEPGVSTKLVQGDTLKLGESSRLYRLDWVPISLAYEINDPFVPQLDALDIVEEETEGTVEQDENSLFLENGQQLSDKIEGLESQSSEENLDLSTCNKENEICSSQISPLDASFAVDEGPHGVIDENTHSLLHRNDEGQGLSETMNDIEQSFSDENLALPLDASFTVEEETEGVIDMDSASLVHRYDEGQRLSETMNDLEQPFCDDMENNVSSEICDKHNEFSSSQLCEIGKENSPQVHIPSPLLQKEENTEYFEMNSEKRLVMNIWSRRGKSASVNIETSRSKAMINASSEVKPLLGGSCVKKPILKDEYASLNKDEEIFTPDKENASPNSCLVRSLAGKFDEALKSGSISNITISTSDEYLEVFTSDKENMTPDSNLFRSIKNIQSSQEVKQRSNLHKSSPSLATVDSQQHKVLQEIKPAFYASKSQCKPRKQPYVVRAEKREPFLSLPLISTDNDKAASIASVHESSVKGSKSINYSVNLTDKSTSKEIENRWTIVVDTACLLKKKSRRELHLLRGLRGTSLFIPRIVLRELDCMVRRASFLSRMTDASSALQWIEECMACVKWWIHVQSSAEESSLVPPTPPAASAYRFSEEKGAFSIGSIPFSPYTLQEIVTPTAADHILESALFFKQTVNGQLALLSDDVTLKIKAMAEGVICETAKEFRASLVNPFSSRFLYANSSPRGATWSCMDDTVLKEKYYPSPSKKTAKSGDGAKGLKLILLHNSNFRQLRA